LNWHSPPQRLTHARRRRSRAFGDVYRIHRTASRGLARPARAREREASGYATSRALVFGFPGESRTHARDVARDAVRESARERM